MLFFKSYQLFANSFGNKKGKEKCLAPLYSSRQDASKHVYFNTGISVWRSDLRSGQMPWPDKWPSKLYISLCIMPRPTQWHPAHGSHMTDLYSVIAIDGSVVVTCDDVIHDDGVIWTVRRSPASRCTWYFGQISLGASPRATFIKDVEKTRGKIRNTLALPAWVVTRPQ